MMSEENLQPENRMGYAPVKGLLLKMSFPLMISMFVQAAYNIVDSMFVSWINEDALTAVSMCFPIQALILAFAIGTAVGMSALILDTWEQNVLTGPIRWHRMEFSWPL